MSVDVHFHIHSVPWSEHTPMIVHELLALYCMCLDSLFCDDVELLIITENHSPDFFGCFGLFSCFGFFGLKFNFHAELSLL